MNFNEWWCETCRETSINHYENTKFKDFARDAWNQQQDKINKLENILRSVIRMDSRHIPCPDNMIGCLVDHAKYGPIAEHVSKEWEKIEK